MILPAQQIRSLCRHAEMITPFTERGVQNGKSYGLSACSYDVRIRQNLVLAPGECALVSTVERFKIPKNICAFVVDKSSYARVFVSAFNTLLDPGWEGCLTVELANLGYSEVAYTEGDPLCQIVFHWLAEETELPYKGKYQNQEDFPVPARTEHVFD